MKTIPKIILHACTLPEWEQARKQGAYTADTLSTEGFIHCSEMETLIRVANANWVGRQDLYLLAIVEEKLEAPVVYESTDPSSDMPYPHIYGPLNLDAVISVTPFLPNRSGMFNEDSIRIEVDQ